MPITGSLVSLYWYLANVLFRFCTSEIRTKTVYRGSVGNPLIFHQYGAPGRWLPINHSLLCRCRSHRRCPSVCHTLWRFIEAVKSGASLSRLSRRAVHKPVLSRQSAGSPRMTDCAFRSPRPQSSSRAASIVGAGCPRSD